MQDFPHHYRCIATANADQSRVRVASQGLENLTTDGPKEFGGPGDQWSPEALLIAAVADCFVLTFRAMARPSQIPGTHSIAMPQAHWNVLIDLRNSPT